MQHENSEKFADRLALLIERHGGSKKSIADHARIHPVTLSKYLSGKRIPATEELHNLASVLCVTTEWLLTGNGDSKPVNLDQVLATKAAESTARIARVEDANTESSANPKLSPASAQKIDVTKLTEDETPYRVKKTERGVFTRTFLDLIERMDSDELVRYAEELQSTHPEGYHEVIREILKILRQRIP